MGYSGVFIGVFKYSFQCNVCIRKSVNTAPNPRSGHHRSKLYLAQTTIPTFVLSYSLSILSSFHLPHFLGPGIDANYTAGIPLTRVHIQFVLIARIILGGITYIFRLLYEHASVGLLYDPLYVLERSTTLMATQPLNFLLANTRSRPQFLRSFMILGLNLSICFMQHADAVPRRENSVRISLPIVIT